MGRSVSAQKGTQNRDEQYFQSLLPRKKQFRLDAQEEVLLHHHRKPDEDSDHYSHQARCEDQEESLVKVKVADAVAREANGAQHCDLF